MSRPPTRRAALAALHDMLLDVRRECAPLAVNAIGPDEDHAITLTFAEMTERTRCDAFPAGLDFTSNPEGHRRLFYDERLNIAREPGLYYTSVYGLGMKFTANPLLGLKWREEFELERTYSAAERSHDLWLIARDQVPEQAGEAATAFLTMARERGNLLDRIRRNSDNEFRRLRIEEERRTGKRRALGAPVEEDE